MEGVARFYPTLTGTSRHPILLIFQHFSSFVKVILFYSVKCPLFVGVILSIPYWGVSWWVGVATLYALYTYLMPTSHLPYTYLIPLLHYSILYLSIAYISHIYIEEVLMMGRFLPDRIPLYLRIIFLSIHYLIYLYIYIYTIY